MIECDVKLDYEVFNAYNPKATIEIDLHAFTLKILTRLDDTLESIKERREDIFEEFAKRVISVWSESEGAADIDYGAVSIGEIEQELPNLTERMVFLRPALRFILSHLRSQGAKVQTPRKTTVLYIDREKAENILFYNVVKVLVDLLGKEEGISTYKDAVDYLADRRAEDEPDTTKIEQFRQGLTGSLPATGGYTFAVADLDDSMILAKFDKCVVHESLRHVSDPELAYYATCYTNMTVANRRNRNVEIRRTQTLFSGEFCDELYWDPEVHDEPAQPSLAVSRNLRIE
ncbi:MAG: L-2-amino-thiazoline-4-carboxylic acid hydrolase, partial [Promethearchaeota archaeon]